MPSEPLKPFETLVDELIGFARKAGRASLIKYETLAELHAAQDANAKQESARQALLARRSSSGEGLREAKTLLHWALASRPQGFVQWDASAWRCSVCQQRGRGPAQVHHTDDCLYGAALRFLENDAAAKAIAASQEFLALGKSNANALRRVLATASPKQRDELLAFARAFTDILWWATDDVAGKSFGCDRCSRTHSVSSHCVTATFRCECGRRIEISPDRAASPTVASHAAPDDDFDPIGPEARKMETRTTVGRVGTASERPPLAFDDEPAAPTSVPTRIEEIKQRLAARTQGEWEAGRADMATVVDGVESKWIYARKDERSQYLAVASGQIDGPWEEVMANAEFIAHAPADIAYLLSLAVRAEGLTQRVAELEAVVADVWAIAQGTVFASPPQASAGIAEDAKQVVQWATKAMDALGRIGLKTAKVRSLTLKTPTP